ncbi:hypothetical protein [Pseudomonas sp. B111]|uniref:hypothetical protein n=1 Tax=unclassified Pseudomonas TaxID=196821 RepID=UPI000F77B942|nr:MULTISPECIES: hypothetical protein [unclassified Pseudomonas]UZX36771.1 hypothetical protein M6E97_30425 [Pseudomonas sp. B111]
MDDVEQLRAQVEAQGCVINHLLVACMRHGIIDPQALADECRERRASPTSIAADPRAGRLLLKELDAWAELLIDQHHADAESPDA